MRSEVHAEWIIRQTKEMLNSSSSDKLVIGDV